MTSTEFVDWLAFLEWEVNDFHREDHYWAQIAAEIRRVLSKHPDKIKNEDFVLEFKVKEPPREKTVEEKISLWQASKAAWLGAFGFNPDGTKKEKK